MFEILREVILFYLDSKHYQILRRKSDEVDVIKDPVIFSK